MLKKWLWCDCSAKWVDIAPLALRLAVGAVFVAHGYQKIQNLSGVEGFFATLGIPDPGLFAFLVAVIEFFGGIALMAGFMTHWAAKLCGVILVFAFYLVHMEQGWGGSEFVVTLFAGLVAIMILGAGKWSVDAWLVKQGWKPSMGM